jgi:hypothetical protein
MNKTFISIFLFISYISSSAGQEVTVTSSFDTSRIFIGDQIIFTITVDQPSDLSLSLPFFKDTLCKNLEIISGPVVDSSKKENRVKIIEKYLVTSFDSGFYQVPPVFAEIKNEKGLKRFFSDYSQLEVMRVKVAPADTTLKIYDIIKPYKAPVTLGEVIPWVLLVAILCLAVFALVRFVRKYRKSRTGTEVIIDPDPAHVIAFRELEKLREEELWQKGEIKNYYTKLTEILRRFLENRFKVFSLELTTAETLDTLVKTGFKKNGSYNKLRTVLSAADLVKFAKYNPEPSENVIYFQNSWDFVMETKEEKVFKNEADDKEKGKEAGL